jgi:cytochrome c oxidase assembly protein subunit 11
MARRVSNGRYAAGLVAIVIAMVGMSFAAVPLYRVFCQGTGFDGTPLIGLPAPGSHGAGQITVRFGANTQRDIPWRFEPGQREMRVALGDEAAAFYVARNTSSGPVRGVSTYNVTPERAAQYFHKTACFCFEEQTLAAGQDMQFPLSFWVDPKIAEDRETRDLRTVTLSYTFFRSLNDADREGALANAGPHVGSARTQN